MQYPNKNITIDALVAAARHAAMESNAEHPQDIAIAMSEAIDSSWVVIEHLNKCGLLDNPDPNVVE